MNEKTFNQHNTISGNRCLLRNSLIELLICFSIIVFFYSNTIAQMVGLWSASDTYAHGFIVPFISVWLIWRIRENWMMLVPERSWTASLLILAAAGLWLAGNLVAINAITQLALVSIIILCIPALLGWKIALAMSFPLLFLYFSVPIGDFLLPIMMEWTADFTVVALRFTGIPVYRENLQFVIPSGNWSVVEACSGIRYLIASVTIGCLFSYINYKSYKKRIAFIFISIIVPLVANWLRAYLIVLIGHYSGNELATGVDHLIYGWLFFGLVITIMLFMGARWADEPAYEEKIPNNNIIKTEIKKSKIYNYGFYISIISIIILPHLLVTWIFTKNIKLPVKLENVLAAQSWNESESVVSDWQPGFLHAAAQSNQNFKNENDSEVGLHISYYRQQDYKSKLVTSTNSLISNSDNNWIKKYEKRKTITTKNTSFEIKDSVIQRKKAIGNEISENLHIWYFYWVNGKIIASNVNAKIQGALGQIAGNGDDGAIVAIYVPYISSEFYMNDIKATDKILKDFINDNEKMIISALEKTRDRN